MDFLMQQVGPFPLVVWAGIIVGGAVLAWWLSRRLGGRSGTSPTAPAENPNIDPSTGLPYVVENATDPNTGRPIYTLYNPPPQPTPAPTTGSGGGNPAPFTGGPVGQPCGSNGIWILDPKGSGNTICSSGDPSGPPSVMSPGIPPASFNVNPPWAGAPSGVAYGSSWPEPNHTLYDVWQDHGAGIPWPDWEHHVRRLNPQVGKSGRLLPNEPVRIP